MISNKKVNHFLLTCGDTDNQQEFVKAVLDGIKDFCNYDHATAYLFSGNQKIVDRYLVNFDPKQSDVYLKYYSAASFDERGTSSSYAINFDRVSVSTIAWDKVKADEFSTDYIKAQGIKHSAYFILTDPNGTQRTLFALDRTRDKAFSEIELDILRFIIPHLNNLHKKFFLAPKDKADRKRALMAIAGLTARETEISLLLCDGVSPANISSTLHIAPATTHKHIAHIYEKLHVSNLQELLVYLLNSEIRPAMGGKSED